MFRDHPPWADYLVKTSSLTRDIKQFATWFSSLNYRGASLAFFVRAINDSYKGGGYSENAICEGLCAARKLGNSRKADEKYYILITNSSPRNTPCSMCCDGDCASHAAQLAKVCTLCGRVFV